MISTLLYGNFFLGSVSLRQIFFVIALIICIVGQHFKYDRSIFFYILFILCFLVSSLFDNYGERALLVIIGRHLVACVAFFYTASVYKIRKGYETVFGTFTIIGIFNAIVTIAQLLHIDDINSMLASMHLDLGTQMLEDGYYSYHDVGDFSFAMPGIFESPVANGVFSSAAVVAALFLPLKRNNQLITYLPWLITLIGCFATQQRTAFVGALVMSMFCIYKISLGTSKNLFKKLFVPMVILICISVAFNYYMSSDITSRYEDVLDMSSRTYIYSMSMDFIPNNFFFGGIYRFLDIYHKYPHNLIFNAFIFGGLFGAVPIFMIYYSHIKDSLKSLFSKTFNTIRIESLLPAAIVVLLFGESLFHNQSIITGDVTYWLFAAFFCAPSVNNTKL